jgi:hypothetical protein
MEKSVNRVADALVNWMAEQNNMKASLGDKIVDKRHFHAQQLNCYKSILKEFANTKDPAEKRMLNLVKGEKRDLEKLVYPNKLVRFFVKGAESISNGVKLFYTAADKIAEYLIERKNAQRAASKDERKIPIISEKKAVDRGYKVGENKLATGPDRDLRRNNTEMGRGTEEQVRNNRDYDLPLLPKRSSVKSQNNSVNGDLLQKNREGTGKGVKI